ASAAARLRFLTATSPSGRIRWRDLSSVPPGTRSRQLRGSFAAVPQLPARGPPRPPSLGPGCYRPWEPAAMSRAGDDLRGGEGEAGGQADPIPAGDQAGAAARGEDVQVPPAGLHPVGAVAGGEFHPPVQGPAPGAVDHKAGPRAPAALISRWLTEAGVGGGVADQAIAELINGLRLTGTGVHQVRRGTAWC